MMSDVINTLTFDFNCKSEQTAKFVSDRISNFWIDQLSKILSGLISENMDNDMIWKIDKLEVDLGDIRIEDIGSQDIYVKLEELLAETIETARSQTVKTWAPAFNFHMQILKTLLLTGDLPWWINKNGFGNLDFTMQSAIDNDLQELKNFLFSHHTDPKIMRRIQMFCSPEMVSVLAKMIPGLYSNSAVNLFGNERNLHWDKIPFLKLKSIVSALNKSFKTTGLKYLIIQNLLENNRLLLIKGISLLKVFSEEKLYELESDLILAYQYSKAEKWLLQLQGYQLEFLRHPENENLGSLRSNRFKRLFKKIQNLKPLIASLIVNHPAFLANNILDLLVGQAPLTRSADIPESDKQLDFLAFLQRVQKTHDDLRNIVKKLDRRKSAHFIKVITRREFTSGASKKTIELVLARLPEKDLQLITQLLWLGKSDLENIFEANQSDSFNKVIIENAGLCILAPFLPSFFNTLGFIENGKFKSRHKAHRAVYLLEYLVNGQQKNHEYKLQLNKLLCGIETEEPISGYKRLTPFERNEANDLITSVISHWKVLRSTSVRGLQSSFIQRKGILTENEDYWTLQVEKASYDLLVDNLPWNYRQIKFSWMKKMVQVEW